MSKLEAGSGGLTLESEFVDGGTVLTGKLVGTLLGSIWLVFASGWIAVVNAIVTINLVPIRGLEMLYTRIISTFGREAAATSQLVWSEAFRAAVDASPVLAPAIMTAELAAVWLILEAGRQRWT